jgi:septal ring factor EnvC (AmiA/AmiB activator)
MKPSDFLLQATDLERKLLQFMADYHQLRKERDELAEANARMEDQLKQQAQEMKNLRKQLGNVQNNFSNSRKITKLVKSMQADSNEAAELREMIDGYIQEIDQCIRYLMNA